MYAFSVPAVLPPDRIVKVNIPAAPAAASSHIASLADGDGDGNATADETAGNETNSTLGNETDSDVDNATAVAVVAEDATPVETKPDEPALPGEVTPEGVHIGFGPGLSPPRADVGEPCCMCPLYDPK
jgi:hypothetical protein